MRINNNLQHIHLELFTFAINSHQISDYQTQKQILSNLIQSTISYQEVTSSFFTQIQKLIDYKMMSTIKYSTAFVLAAQSAQAIQHKENAINASDLGSERSLSANSLGSILDALKNDDGERVNTFEESFDNERSFDELAELNTPASQASAANIFDLPQAPVTSHLLFKSNVRLQKAAGNSKANMKRGTPIKPEDAKMMMEKKAAPEAKKMLRAEERPLFLPSQFPFSYQAKKIEYESGHSEMVGMYKLPNLVKGFGWQWDKVKGYNGAEEDWSFEKAFLNGEQDGFGVQWPERYSWWFNLADKLNDKMRRSGFLWLSGKSRAFKKCSEEDLQPVKDAFQALKDHRKGITSENKKWKSDEEFEKKSSYSETNMRARTELLAKWYKAFKNLAKDDKEMWAVFLKLVRDANRIEICMASLMFRD
jgi:hypothetical protein